ncbi:hypothetical protein [Streptomyces sp. NPDC002215]|uniref:hypothetical protein n=1 Tax=Streptomyces sp. NPDC002215 TaxID=3154412 RepID=UPI00332EBBC2
MSEWTREAPVTEPVYNPADPQSGRALVEYHLRELGLGESLLVEAADNGLRIGRCVVPQDLGVCRARVLTEGAWPEDADLCVTVDWSPDAALRRDHNTGRVLAGAAEHWRERISATARALESLGYIVEPSRVRCSPYYHPSAELLVYRMPAGMPARQIPADTVWALKEPVPPHYQRRNWSYPEQSPEDIVREALTAAGLRHYQTDHQSPHDRIAIRSITQTVWPPEADRCTWLTWWPAPSFARALDTGLLPAGAEAHWRERLGLLHQGLADAGLALRSRARSWRPVDDEAAHFLVYRVAA